MQTLSVFGLTYNHDKLCWFALRLGACRPKSTISKAENYHQQGKKALSIRQRGAINKAKRRYRQGKKMGRLRSPQDDFILRFE
jgi:hypothetical protein